MSALLIEQLQIAHSGVGALMRSVRSAYPDEACGLLLGEHGGSSRERVVRVFCCDNHAADRRTGYVIAPLAYLDAERCADAAGLRVLGVWHSHPDGSALPSVRDRRDAWPGWWYLIAGWQPGNPLDLRLWRLPDCTSSDTSQLINGFVAGSLVVTA